MRQWIRKTAPAIVSLAAVVAGAMATAQTPPSQTARNINPEQTNSRSTETPARSHVGSRVSVNSAMDVGAVAAIARRMTIIASNRLNQPLRLSGLSPNPLS